MKPRVTLRTPGMPLTTASLPSISFAAISIWLSLPFLGRDLPPILGILVLSLILLLVLGLRWGLGRAARTHIMAIGIIESSEAPKRGDVSTIIELGLSWGLMSLPLHSHLSNLNNFRHSVPGCIIEICRPPTSSCQPIVTPTQMNQSVLKRTGMYQYVSEHQCKSHTDPKPQCH